MVENQEAHIHLRIAPELKEHLQKQSERLGLTLSSWIKMQLAELSNYRKEEQESASARS